jgi:hypothetical protein
VRLSSLCSIVITEEFLRPRLIELKRGMEALDNVVLQRYSISTLLIGTTDWDNIAQRVFIKLIPA